MIRFHADQAQALATFLITLERSTKKRYFINILVKAVNSWNTRQ